MLRGPFVASVTLALAVSCGARTPLEVGAAGCVPSDDDADGDCFEVPDDCDDDDPRVHPGALDPPLDSGWRIESVSIEGGADTLRLAVEPRGCVNIATGAFATGGRFARGTSDGFEVTPVRSANARLAQLVVDRAGAVHGLVVSGEAFHELSFVSRGDDGAWTEEHIARVGGIGAPALALDPGGDAHVIVPGPHPSSGVELLYGRRSRDWALERVATAAQAYDTRLLLDAVGRPHVAWSTHWAMPWLMRADRDDGGTWHVADVDEQGDRFGTMGAAIDGEDVVHWVYRHARRRLPALESIDGELRYATSRGSRELVTSRLQPWCVEAAVGPDGLLHVLFVGSGPELATDEPTNEVVHAVRHPDGWRFETLATREVLAIAGSSCAFAFDGLGVAHAAWTTPSGIIRYGRGPGPATIALDEDCDGVDGIADPCAP